jgi:dephospho-CoA kinase
MSFIVGLTGGIGSGKSAVAELFRGLGIEVVDADIAARKVVEPDSPALMAIAEHFGSAIIQQDGNLDRAALREIIFNDEQDRLWLEQLLHPAIGLWLTNKLSSASSPYAILESPLLLETTQHQLVDRILVVDVNKNVQIERASARDNNTPEQIKAIIATQMERTIRLERADDVIDNNGPPETLKETVNQFHQTYLRLANQKLEVKRL